MYNIKRTICILLLRRNTIKQTEYASFWFQETCRWPVHELDSSLGLDGSHRSIHILWNDISPVHHAACHVLSMTRIALHKHGCRFENWHRDLSNWELFVVGLLGRDDRGIAWQHEVDAWVRYKVGLEFQGRTAGRPMTQVGQTKPTHRKWRICCTIKSPTTTF